MSKKILEISLSVFLIVCSISLLFGIKSLGPVLESQNQLVEMRQQNQKEVLSALKSGVSSITLFLDSRRQFIETTQQNQKEALSALASGVASVQSMFDSQRLLIENAHQNQEEIYDSADDLKSLIIDISYAIAVIGMIEERMIPPATGDKMLNETINDISEKSERFGELAEYLNEYRINHSR